jgi:hypothetical protein
LDLGRELRNYICRSFYRRAWLHLAVEKALHENLRRTGLRLPDAGLTLEQTKELEYKPKSVWGLTQDFFWEEKTGYLDEVVIPNIRWGKSYRYFCSDTAHSKKVGEKIASKISARHHVEFVYVPEHIMEAVQYEIAIFDPLGSQKHGIISDIAAMRYIRPDDSWDVTLHRKFLLSKFIALAETWSPTYPPVKHTGVGAN